MLETLYCSYYKTLFYSTILYLLTRLHGFITCSFLSRPVGFDISKGEKILSRGDLLGPAELGLLATAGVQQVVKLYAMLINTALFQTKTTCNKSLMLVDAG